ncbi:hypothetical protein RDI58_017038 [Solanum bulbocastanum]|uniref:PDZ domain-containing protein n=1 Tax=Solanum bulbocastanum TaxID=147425 RepID=A0AAN8T916_SOLBU
MVGTNLKAETMKLMDERTNTEAEMDVIIQRLCQPGGPGLSGNLVDSEGFPRTDIDIPTVRGDRRRLAVIVLEHAMFCTSIATTSEIHHLYSVMLYALLLLFPELLMFQQQYSTLYLLFSKTALCFHTAELRNDHKIVTGKIDQNIQVLHSARLASTPSVKDSVSASGRDRCMSNSNTFPNASVGFSRADFICTCADQPADLQVSFLTIIFAYPTEISYLLYAAAGLGVQGSAVNIGSSSSPGNYSVTAATSAAMDIDVVFSRPFAVIDEITEASPAAEDGLQLGDQVVRFGNVQSGENLLQRLAAEAQSNQGCAVTMTVLRQGAMTNVQVTPRVWQGRGLLGRLFELLVLCGALAELTWPSILNRRHIFREVFADFDPVAVSRLNEKKILHLEVQHVHYYQNLNCEQSLKMLSLQLNLCWFLLMSDILIKFR